MSHSETATVVKTRATTARDIALIATFAALVAVCAILPAINFGGLVPITLQTFAVVLTGAVLGAKRGFLAIALYLAVGAMGLPIFTNGGAGLAPFAGPSVGYFLSFPLLAALVGFLVQRRPGKNIGMSVLNITLAAVFATIVTTYPLGILGMAWRADLTLGQAFMANLVFTPGDLIKCVLAATVAVAVHRAFPDLLPRRVKRTPKQ